MWTIRWWNRLIGRGAGMLVLWKVEAAQWRSKQM